MRRGFGVTILGLLGESLVKAFFVLFAKQHYSAVWQLLILRRGFKA